MTIDRRSLLTAGALAAAAPAVAQAGAQAGAPGDPLGVRGDFPILQNGRTFLNGAYVMPIPRQVVTAIAGFAEAKASRPVLVPELLGNAEKARRAFAGLINASPDEVGILFSTAEGENVIANGLDLKPGENVVIDQLHYDSEFVIYQEIAKQRGIELRIVKHRGGRAEPKDFEPLIDKKTRLVSVAWISHQNGFRHDLKALADLAHSKGAYLYADVIQGVGAIPLDVKATGVDFVCAGSYKWMLAGFGVAPLYVRAELLDRLRLDRFGEFQVKKTLADGTFELDRTARKFDYSSRAFGECLGLAAGIAYVQNVGVARIEAHTVPMGLRLQEGLAAQGHKLFTPMGNRSAIVTFYAGKPMGDLRKAFEAAKIDVKVANGQVRIAPALFNTMDDIEHCLEATKTMV
jgi:selenocysteine lyase/cysteine desulfurase